MRTGELKKKLRKAGCYKIREGGNHEMGGMMDRKSQPEPQTKS